MSADAQTLDVYAREADRYAAMVATAGKDRALEAFIRALPGGAHVLDLGCGPGHAAARMMAAGLRVDAIDAAPAFVAMAQQRYGVPARLARFDQIIAVGVYAGVWASFSLLHAPKTEMPGHLARLHRALCPRGCLSLGLKQGRGEHRDTLGRFYARYGRAEIRRLLRAAGFTVTGIRTGTAAGLSGSVDPWMVLSARA